MLTMQKTKRTIPTNPTNVFCSECGWEDDESEVPYGSDPWTTDGGALCYCPECGMVDDLNFPEGV